jgi:release factor glutamine methyltransferase
VVGGVNVAGVFVRVDPGVYVPRLQTIGLAQRAAELLPEHGTAVDLCTGAGMIAVLLRRERPSARVVGTDIDPVACRCARANGVEVYEGDLGEPLPAELAGTTDVVTAVVPYVPTREIGFLPRDSRDYEPAISLDGGPGGMSVLCRAVAAAARLLRPGGSLLLELGGEQAAALLPDLLAAGFTAPSVLHDDEGDARGIEARFHAI